jgi:hypothetical protein
MFSFKKKKGKSKHDFNNPVYGDPTEEDVQHIYNEAGPSVATYEQPEKLVEKPRNKTNSKKVLQYSFCYITQWLIALRKT